MHGDYKYAMQMEAEEIAEQEYGCDFYDLPDSLQTVIYERGMDKWRDKQFARADQLRDEAKYK